MRILTIAVIAALCTPADAEIIYSVTKSYDDRGGIYASPSGGTLTGTFAADDDALDDGVITKGELGKWDFVFVDPVRERSFYWSSRWGDRCDALLPVWTIYCDTRDSVLEFRFIPEESLRIFLIADDNGSDLLQIDWVVGNAVVDDIGIPGPLSTPSAIVSANLSEVTVVPEPTGLVLLVLGGLLLMSRRLCRV